MIEEFNGAKHLYSTYAESLQKWKKAPHDNREQRRARLLLEVTALSKRLCNERIAFENALTPEGMELVSRALHLIQASQATVPETPRISYGRKLWNALLNRA